MYSSCVTAVKYIYIYILACSFFGRNNIGLSYERKPWEKETNYWVRTCLMGVYMLYCISKQEPQQRGLPAFPPCSGNQVTAHHPRSASSSQLPPHAGPALAPLGINLGSNPKLDMPRRKTQFTGMADGCRISRS